MKSIIVRENLSYQFNVEEVSTVFDVESNKDVELNLSNFESVNEINIYVKDNSFVRLAMFANKPVKNLKFTANIGENSKIIVYFADFSKDVNHLEAAINLNKDNATCEWHLASLSDKTDDKQIAVSIFHNHPNTFGKIDNYGVCKDTSKLIFSGISHILNGCHHSKSHQNAKIVVFDNDCKAIAKPILKIDENDIEASHAAVVGKVSDDHIFYLTSRGLTVDEAKLLITLGYLKPILKGFDEVTANEINKNIEERI